MIVQRREDIGGSSSTATLMEASVQLNASAALPKRKGHMVRCVWGLAGPKNQCGRSLEDKYLLLVPGIEPRFLQHNACSLLNKLSHSMFPIT